MISIILVVYKSDEKKLNKILKIIGNKYNIIIIDNSLNYNFKKIKLSKKTKIIRSVNKGNGAGINLALKNCKTNFALYFDIDVEFERKFISKFIKHSKKIKNFSILIPNHGRNKEKKLPIKYYIGEASVMLLNNRYLKKIGFFDENFFLYFEEIDILLRSKREKIATYLLPFLKIKHMRSSSIKKNIKIDLLRAWHYTWSMFYFYKKNFTYLFALKKISLFIVKDFIMFFFYLLLLDKKNYKLRFYRLFGAISSVIGLKSFLRP